MSDPDGRRAFSDVLCTEIERNNAWRVRSRMDGTVIRSWPGFGDEEHWFTVYITLVLFGPDPPLNIIGSQSPDTN